MRRIIIMAVMIIIVIAAVKFIYTPQSPSPTPQISNTQITQTVNQTPASNSRYAEYSKSALETASTNRRVLFFYASWCPVCKPADAEFKQKSNQIPSDLTLLRVNYNDPDTDQQEKDLAAKYNVTYQHTFVQIDAQGNEVAKWNGGNLAELLSNIK